MRETELRTRLRLLSLLICCLSGPAGAAGLPPLVVSPDLVRGRPDRDAPPPAPAEASAPARPSAATREEAIPPAATVRGGPTRAPEIAPRAPQALPPVPGTRGPVPAPVPAPVAPSPEPLPAPGVAAGEAAPPEGTTAVTADRIYGTRSVELVAEGNAALQRDDVELTADRVVYHEITDEAEARGDVRLAQDGTVITGPAARLQIGEQVGEFESPAYRLTRESPVTAPGETSRVISGRGHADTMYFEGENQYRLKNATWTTCEPDDPDWYIKARDLQLDYDREVGTVKGGSVVFKDTPIFWWPWAEFPLVGQRQSGFLAPTYGASNKVGVDISAPYYWNIAPNYDATIVPRFMGRRGLQLGGEFRYLTPGYAGEARVEWLPKDNVTGEERTFGSFQHQQRFSSTLYGALDFNGVSDDEYFEDLSSRVSVTSRTHLLRQATLSYVPSDWWYATALLQSYQTLTTEDFFIEDPYKRLPQLRLNAARHDLFGGSTFAFESEYVQFEHSDNNRDEGSRLALYPQIALPFERPGYYITPKIGVHHTQYDLNRSPGNEQARDSITRTLPIFTLDTGLNFERDMTFFGQNYLQTLEPRIYYVHVPFEDQSDVPVFDTARYDFGFAQIFSEFLYSGRDRIADANQVTAAVTTRLINPETGAERLRAALGQRYYFDDQEVTLPGEPQRTSRRADLLAAFSGRLTQTSTLESAWQYNPRDSKTERLNVGVRFQPGYAKAFNIRYRYATDAVQGLQGLGLEDVDLSGQWPLGGNWYGVGRVTRSLLEERVTEALAGLEYDGGCWVFRVAAHRFAIDPEDVNQSIFVQLELNGLGSVGSSPLNLLQRSVPGYGKINEPVGDRIFGAPY